MGRIVKLMPVLKQVSLERQCSLWSVFRGLPVRPSQAACELGLQVQVYSRAGRGLGLSLAWGKLGMFWAEGKKPEEDEQKTAGRQNAASREVGTAPWVDPGLGTMSLADWILIVSLWPGGAGHAI